LRAHVEMTDRATLLGIRTVPAAALPLRQRAPDACCSTGSQVAVPYNLSKLGDTYTQAGRYPNARKAPDEGLALAEKNGDCVQEADLHPLKGQLDLAEADDRAAADACFRTAVETARLQQSKAWELRATMGLARS
jgi:hypothetical protein